MKLPILIGSVLGAILALPAQATSDLLTDCGKGVHSHGVGRITTVPGSKNDEGLPLTSLQFEISPMPDAFATGPRAVPTSFAGFGSSEFLRRFDVKLRFAYETTPAPSDRAIEFHSDGKWIGSHLHKMDVFVSGRTITIVAWKMYRSPSSTGWDGADHELKVTIDFDQLPQLGFWNVEGTPTTFLYQPGKVWLTHHKDGEQRPLVSGARIACIGNFEKLLEL